MGALIMTYTVWSRKIYHSKDCVIVSLFLAWFAHGLYFWKAQFKPILLKYDWSIFIKTSTDTKEWKESNMATLLAE